MNSITKQDAISKISFLKKYLEMSQFILMSIGSYSTKYTNKFISTRKSRQHRYLRILVKHPEDIN